MQRILIPVVFVVVGFFFAWAMLKPKDGAAPGGAKPPAASQPVGGQTAGPANAPTPPTPATPTTPNPAPVNGQEKVAPTQPPVTPAKQPAISAANPLWDGLKVKEVGKQPDPILGKIDGDPQATPHALRVQLITWGAGVKAVDLARYFDSEDRKKPLAVQVQMAESKLGENRQFRYPLAALSMTINGGAPFPLGDKRWEVIADQTNDQKATFELEIQNGQGKPVLKLRRVYELPVGDYDLRLLQSVENLSGEAAAIRLIQYGPGDLPEETGYIDLRMVVLGYYMPKYDPQYKLVLTRNFDFPRATAVESGLSGTAMWPVASDDVRELSWVAVNSRYFSAMTFALMEKAATPEEVQVRRLDEVWSEVRPVAWGTGADVQLLMSLHSREIKLAAAGAGATARLDLSTYFGPKQRKVMNSDSRYARLKLDNVVVYNLGSMCSFCTWAWLANGLLGFMSLIEMLFQDWGVAIILLVAVVRLILHPLTKSSQINMQKMSKQMQLIQPEMNRLKQKYANDKAKLQQEQMQLFREKGVNPLSGSMGCLPMFLQMPIWFALYAMLYCAIELRQEPAFWNVFHRIGELFGANWQFMTDLSSPDQFVSLGQGVVIPLIGYHLKAVNLLPIMMAGVFYVQNKYMTPAPAPGAEISEQQRQQQFMMRIMLFLFPLFLYSAPSGLNLYIITSTLVGIFESKAVKKHIAELEASGRLSEKKKPKEGSWMARIQKRIADQQKAMEQAEQQAKKNKKGR